MHKLERVFNSSIVLTAVLALASCAPKNYYRYKSAMGKVKIPKYYNMHPDSVKMSRKDAIKLYNELNKK